MRLGLRNVVGTVEARVPVSVAAAERLGCLVGAAGSHPVIMRRESARGQGQQRGKQS